MPKNEKSKKNSGGAKSSSREMVYKEETDQVYGIAGKAAGDGGFMIKCDDGQDRFCRVRGAMKRGKMNHVSEGDLVLVSLRGYEDNKADIIHRYTHDEVRRLKKEGHLALPTDDKTIHDDGPEDDGFDFDAI